MLTLLVALVFIVLFIVGSSKLAFGDLTIELKDQIASTTLDQWQKELVNHTILDIPLYMFLMQSKYRKDVTGGDRIRFPFIIDKNTSFGWFGKGDPLSPQEKDIHAFGYAHLKQGAGDVTIDDVDVWANSGPGAFIDIVSDKTESLIQGMKEELNKNMWSDGTGSGGKEIPGLKAHIPSSPNTGTYMGHNRATEYWARIWYDDGATTGPHSLTAPTGNAVQSVGAIGDISDAYPTIVDSLNKMWRGIMSKGDSKSDIVNVVDAETLLWYKKMPLYAKTVEIGTTRGPLDIGVDLCYFMGTPILDDTIENGAIAGEWRTLNLKYYRIVVDTTNFYRWEGPRTPFNALRNARYCIVRFTVVCTKPRKMGLLDGITDWQP